ncbi:MAG: hypothetical protein L6Q92_10710 [Phycisphaerae bacterium]|nr:hypothetical protein [Phycisphaerae bacterium]
MTHEGARAETERIVYVMPRQTANWIIATALSVIATVLVVRGGGPIPDNAAFAQNTLVGSRGLHAFTGQLDKNTYGLFMMDVDAGTVWVYEYVPLKRRLKLVAARSFAYDRYLENYNGDEETSPAIIEQLIKRQREAKARAAELGAADDSDAATAAPGDDAGKEPPAGARPPRP